MVAHCRLFASARTSPPRPLPRLRQAGSLVQLRTALPCLLILATAYTADWPQWRGPGGQGYSPATNLTLHWSPTNNVRWKTLLPGQGHSSPIVSGHHIFLTTDTEGEVVPGAKAPTHQLEGQDFRHPESMGADRRHTLQVLCLDATDGRIVWQRTVHDGPVYDDRHRKGSYAAATPATDGVRVVSFFGAEGLFCHDDHGTALWKTPFPQFSTLGLGPGSSPIIVSNLVIIQADQNEGQNSFLAAFDLATGRETWRVTRNISAGWSTPILIQTRHRLELAVSGNETVAGYDPLTGRQLWHAKGLENNAIPSPVVWRDIVIFSAGYPNKQAIAVRTGGSGDLANSSHILWHYRRGTAYVPSPIVCDRYVHLVTDSGLMTCLDAESGTARYEGARLPSPAKFTASPVAVAGRILLTAEDGRTFVISSGPEHNVEAVNAIGEPVLASLAIANGRIYLRGESHLFCVGP